MSSQKNNIRKGDFGYLAKERKRRLLITVGLFVLPVLILIIGWVVNGTRNNVLTVLAVVGSLPGCRSLVNLIMVWKVPPMKEEIYRKIREHQKSLVMAYEGYMTFYEKSAFMDAMAVAGNTVVAYSSDPKVSAGYMAEQAQKLIRKNGYKVDVKVLTDLRPFLERLDSMNEHKDSLESGIKFVPDEKYPELSRDELIKHTWLALCL